MNKRTIQYLLSIMGIEMGIEDIVKIAASVTGLIAAIFALRKLYKWLFPINVSPSVQLWFDDGRTPDSIRATVTNKSSEAQYIVKCEARGTFSIWHIIKKHLRNPLLKPRLYPNIWYNGAAYSLLKGDPVKLEPFQPVILSCELYEHPLNAMFTPYFIVTVQLSSGKKVRSKKAEAPGRWRNLGRKQLRGNA